MSLERLCPLNYEGSASIVRVIYLTDKLPRLLSWL